MAPARSAAVFARNAMDRADRVFDLQRCEGSVTLFLATRKEDTRIVKVTCRSRNNFAPRAILYASDPPYRGLSPYPLTSEQQDAEKDHFVRSIDLQAVCDLASRHNHGKSCKVFDTANGSFNACCFVEFSDGERWVVRIPIQPVVYDAWAKIQSEVATMRYIRDRTSIPVSRIHAYGQREILTHDCKPQAFIILDYMPGRPLDVESFVVDSRERRDHFYSQLTGVLTELRQLEFPSAGALMPDPKGRHDPVVGPLQSIHINHVQSQGLEIEPRIFSRAVDFVHQQLDVLSQYYQLPMSEQSLKTAQQEIFAQVYLEQELHRLVDASWDDGPFVLCHMDLRWPNILVDDELNILSYIDWEWAAVVPRQLFTPPTWIAGGEPQHVTSDDFCNEFQRLCQTLDAKSARSYGSRRLKIEWDSDLPDRILPIAELLRHHSQLLSIFYQAIYPRLFDSPKQEVVPRFFRQPENRTLDSEARRRFQASNRYTDYLKERGLFVPDLQAAKALELERMILELQKFTSE